MCRRGLVILFAVAVLLFSQSSIAQQPANQSVALSAVVNGAQVVEGTGDADGKGSVSLVIALGIVEMTVRGAETEEVDL